MTDRKPPETIQVNLGEKRFVPGPTAPPKGISWEKLGGRIAAVWSALPSVLLVVSFVALIGFSIVELRRDVVVIEPIRMPEALRKMGYSGEVAADRLWDAVRRIKKRTPTAKDHVDVQPASQRMDFEPPGTGIALQEVVQMLRRFLRLKETRVVGEFICMKPACKPEELTLTLRVIRGGGMNVVSVPPIGDQASEADIGPYLHAAALDLLRVLDPYVVAFFLYQNDKDAAELEALRLIAPTHPQRKWALNLLGFIAAGRGEYDRAIYWYGRAVKENEENEFAAIAYTNSGNPLYWYRNWYRRAVEENEEEQFAAIAHTNWGNALVAKEKLVTKKKLGAKKNLAEAIERFKLAIRLDPKNAFAHNSWGLALVAEKNLPGAIEQFTRATELDEKYVNAYINWGKALLAKRELAESIVRVTLLAEAIEKFTRATELDPEYAIAYNNLGGALAKTREWAAAIEQFTRATELDPEYAIAYNNLGGALAKTREWAAAIEQFTRATKLDEKYVDAYINWGKALLDNGEPVAAIEQFTRATEIDETYAPAYYNWGNALDKLGKPAAAIEQFTLATEHDPENAGYFIELAFALKALAGTDESADAFELYARKAADAFESHLKHVDVPRMPEYLRCEIKRLRGDPTDPTCK